MFLKCCRISLQQYVRTFCLTMPRLISINLDIARCKHNNKWRQYESWKIFNIISILCRIWGTQSDSYKRRHFEGCSAVYWVCEPTFRRNISAPSSGSKVSLVTCCTLVHCSVHFGRFTYGLHGAISQKMATFNVYIILKFCSKKRQMFLFHNSLPDCPVSRHAQPYRVWRVLYSVI
jgi:hypothetical protein